jgi:hypothetical protein
MGYVIFWIFLAIAYVLFSVWFFCKATKGFVCSPESNPTGKELDIWETLREMSFAGFVIIAFVNPAMEAYGIYEWKLWKFLSKDSVVVDGDDISYYKIAEDPDYDKEEKNAIPDEETKKPRRWRLVCEEEEPYSGINVCMAALSTKVDMEALDPERKLQKAYEDVLLHPERHMKGEK